MAFVGIDMKGAGELIKGVGDAAKGIRAAITGKEIINADKQAELELKAQELEAMVSQAQLAINEAEAGNKSLFVSGWRPALGWVGVLGVAYQFLIGPVMAAFGLAIIPLDMNAMMTMLFGMLGLGTMRTFEKAKGVASK